MVLCEVIETKNLFNKYNLYINAEWLKNVRVIENTKSYTLKINNEIILGNFDFVKKTNKTQDFKEVALRRVRHKILEFRKITIFCFFYSDEFEKTCMG